MLVDHADTGINGRLGGSKKTRAIIDQDAAAIGFDLAGKDAHEGAFPGPVFAQQCLDFTGLNREADIPIGLYRAKGFADAFKTDARCGHGHYIPCFCPTIGCTNWDSLSQGNKIQVSWLTSVI